MCRNQLSSLSANVVASLAACPLRVLDVSMNQLTTLPSNIALLSHLVELRARDNRLSELPALAGSGTLRLLDFSANRLSLWPIAALNERTLRDVRFLFLHNNNLAGAPWHMLGRLDALEYVLFVFAYVRCLMLIILI
jgi:Leucine-rich repeat (LRR) protein